MTISRFSVALVSASLLTTPLAFAQDQQAESSTTNFLTFYSAGMDSLLASPTDAGLLKALQRIDFSRMNMPGMRNNHDPQAIYEMLTSEMSLSIDFDTAKIKDMMAGQPVKSPPFGLQWDVYGKNADQNKFFAERMGGMLAGTGQWAAPEKSTTYPGLSMLKGTDPDAPDTYYGEMNVGGKSAFVLAMTNVTKEPVSLDGYGLPQGIKPGLAVRVDMKAIQPLVEMAMQQSTRNPQAMTSMSMNMLRDSGLMGPNPSVLTFAMGQGNDRTYMVGQYTNCGEMKKLFGPKEGLTAEDIKLIPQDATYASISKFNMPNYFDYYLDVMTTMAAPPRNRDQPNPREMINNMLGFDIKTQFIDYFGETLGVYQGPSTGGQSILALVAVIELSNPNGMKQTMSQLIEMVNKNLSGMPFGRIELLQWKFEGNDLVTLSFSGMPVPMELSMGLGDKHLFLGTSPQSVVAAMDQASGEKMAMVNRSILDNPRFTEMGGNKCMGAMQVQFYDTEAYLNSGYSLTNLAFAAISNMSRTPGLPNSGVGMVMPTYNELSKNVRACVTIATMHGDDLHYEAMLDRSVLVNVTAMMGGLKQFIDFLPLAGVVGAMN